MIHCMLWSIILMIASIVLAARVAEKVDDLKNPSFDRDKVCDQNKCHALNASYVSRMYQYCHFVLKTRFSEMF